MNDFYSKTRERMINIMQNSLKQIRQFLGISLQEFSDIIGLTRQTINNLETNKSKMSSTQYIAICAIIDNYAQDRLEIYEVIYNILNSNDYENSNKIFILSKDNRLLKKWFSYFSENLKVLKSNFDFTGDFENILSEFKIFLDETILYENNFESLIEKYKDFIIRNNIKFFVPSIIIENLEIKANSNEATLSKNAKNCLRILLNMKKENLIEIRGDKNDKNIVNTIISVFTKFKVTHKLAILTKNITIVNHIINLNNKLSGFKILPLYFDENLRILEYNNLYEESEKIDKSFNIELFGWNDLLDNNQDMDSDFKSVNQKHLEEWFELY